MLQQIIQQFKGFSRVIQFIIESKKPVVAHNCLYDIMRIYHQFVDDLPSSYQDFKREFHKSFPEIYDTKHLAWCARRALEVESESLRDLAGKQWANSCICIIQYTLVFTCAYAKWGRGSPLTLESLPFPLYCTMGQKI